METIGDVCVRDYSEKAICVTGDGTKALSTVLKGLGGRFNRYLKFGDEGEKQIGWIFSKKQKDKLIAALKDPNQQKAVIEQEEEANTAKSVPPFIKKYSDKAFAVFGDSRKYSANLKELNGRYNPKLKFVSDDGVQTSAPGWIFGLKRLAAVTELLKAPPAAIAKADEGIAEAKALAEKDEIAPAVAVIEKGHDTPEDAGKENTKRAACDDHAASAIAPPAKVAKAMVASDGRPPAQEKVVSTAQREDDIETASEASFEDEQPATATAHKEPQAC